MEGHQQAEHLKILNCSQRWLTWWEFKENLRILWAARNVFNHFEYLDCSCFKSWRKSFWQTSGHYSGIIVWGPKGSKAILPSNFFVNIKWLDYLWTILIYDNGCLLNFGHDHILISKKLLVTLKDYSGRHLYNMNTTLNINYYKPVTRMLKIIDERFSHWLSFS